jgi:hypothetical protein
MLERDDNFPPEPELTSELDRIHRAVLSRLAGPLAGRVPPRATAIPIPEP